jgi:hypothetical protein
MTVTVNANQHVSKTVINHATNMAKTRQTEVVIFGSKVANQQKHMVVTKDQWDKCGNKDELEFVTIIDRNGQFID